MGETVKVSTENVVAVAAKQKEEISKKKENLLIAVTTKIQIVGIKIDFNKPENFENDELRSNWERDAQLKANEVKKNLEMGLVTVEELGDQIDYCSPNILKNQHANLLNDKKIRMLFAFSAFGIKF